MQGGRRHATPRLLSIATSSPTLAATTAAISTSTEELGLSSSPLVTALATAGSSSPPLIAAPAAGALIAQLAAGGRRARQARRSPDAVRPAGFGSGSVPRGGRAPTDRHRRGFVGTCT